MIKEQELKMYFRLASELSAARLSGDAARLALAIDELEVFAMHAENKMLATRATLALAA